MQQERKLRKTGESIGDHLPALYPIGEFHHVVAFWDSRDKSFNSFYTQHVDTLA